MATKQAEAVWQLPPIEEAEEMPKARRGRRGMDLTPLIEALQDLKPHSLTGIVDVKQRERWARKIREAASRVGLEVRTTFDPKKQRLYFQGYQEGEAPAQGRKKGSRPKKSAA